MGVTSRCHSSVQQSPTAEGAGITVDAPGVVTGDAGVGAEILKLLGTHRAWQRFAAVNS